MYNNLSGDLARSRDRQLDRESRSPERRNAAELHQQRKSRRRRRSSGTSRQHPRDGSWRCGVSGRQR